MISLAVGLAAVIIGTMAFAFWFGVIDGIVSGCFAARTLFGWQQQRYADRLIRQLPDAIQLVVSAVRAGLPVSEAFRAVAREMPKPTGEQFGVVSNEISLGRTPEEALRMLYQRVHVDEYAMFSVTLAVQSRAGGGLAETLETLGDTIRQRVALAGRAKALASQARLSARVLSCLPFLAGFGLYLERPDSLSPLFHDPRGRMLFAIGLTSLTIGVLTMRHMIKKGTTV
jgi:tight adherence protein B